MMTVCPDVYYRPENLQWKHFKPQSAATWMRINDPPFVVPRFKCLGIALEALPIKKDSDFGRLFFKEVAVLTSEKVEVLINNKTQQDFAVPTTVLDKIEGFSKAGIGAKVKYAVKCIFWLPFLLKSHIDSIASKEIALVIKTVTLYNFWKKIDEEKTYSLKDRATMAGKDLLRIVAGPVVLVALIAIGMYGFFDTYNGGMLNDNIQYLVYGSHVAAYANYAPYRDYLLF